ncbi:hypothetical protein SRHO_G00102860 [Serrasalmus rhombeus]
MGSRLLFHCL